MNTGISYILKIGLLFRKLASQQLWQTTEYWMKSSTSAADTYLLSSMIVNRWTMSVCEDNSLNSVNGFLGWSSSISGTVSSYRHQGKVKSVINGWLFWSMTCLERGEGEEQGKTFWVSGSHTGNL